MWWLGLSACGNRTPEEAPLPTDPAACFAAARRLTGEAGIDLAAKAPLECACDGGIGEACTALATWYRDGNPVPADLAKAASLHERACEHGDGWGCNGWGNALSKGNGVVRDLPRSHEAFLKGCNHPVAPSAKACSNAGKQLFTGEHGVQDLTAAAALFDTGCRAGDNICCTQLRIAQEPLAYVQLMEPRCLAQDAQACGNLGAMMSLGSRERHAALGMACQLRHALSCQLLADAP